LESYQKYKRTYERQGYVLIDGFLPADEFGILVENVARYVRDVAPALEDGAAFYQDQKRPETLKQLQRMEEFDPFFKEYCSDRRWNRFGCHPDRRTRQTDAGGVVQQAAR
jgi:phytanoyl-CoA hydroxylase